jgi:hypothetical protein
VVNISTDVLSKVRDGHLVAKFINYSSPDTIDMRALNVVRSTDLTATAAVTQKRDWLENLNVVLGAAKSIGLNTRGVTADKLYEADCSEAGLLAANDLLYSLLKGHLLNEAHAHLIAKPPLSGISEEGSRPEALSEPVVNRWFADFLNKHSVSPARALLRPNLRCTAPFVTFADNER